MERTWVESEGLRRSTDGIEGIRTALAQMLAKRELALQRQPDDNHQGLVDCLRNALKSVESAKLEVETYDAAFNRAAATRFAGNTDEAKTPQETADACLNEIKDLIELEDELPPNKYTAIAEEIAAEIGKLTEVAKVAGFKDYRVELIEQRTTTQLIFARTAKEARRKAMLKEGVVVDVNDDATAAREPKVYLQGHQITQAEMDAEDNARTYGVR